MRADDLRRRPHGAAAADHAGVRGHHRRRGRHTSPTTTSSSPAPDSRRPRRCWPPRPRAGVPIWGDVELAWRLDSSGRFGPPRRWLVVTGTNGKTTTTSMLHAMLVAAGRRSLLCGNIGNPVLDVLDRTVRPAGRRTVQLPIALGAVAAPGGGGGAQRRRRPPRLARHAGRPTPATRPACSTAGWPSSGWTTPSRPVCWTPRPRRCGSASGWANRRPVNSASRDGMLDRQRVRRRRRAGRRRRRFRWPARSACSTRWRRRRWPAPSTCPPRPSPMRWRRSRWAGTAPRWSATVDGVTYVDDSKATNPHAAQASIAAYPRVVWIAGGLLKGASVDELVAASGESAGRSGADRARPGADRRRVIATRPGCPRRRACDGGGFWGAWDN